MQSVAEKLGVFKNAVKGEVEVAINNALKRIYPSENLALGGLHTLAVRGGGFVYKHPSTKAVVGELNVRAAHEKSVWHHDKWGGYKYKSTVKIPFKETILLYAPQGHLDTRINVEHAAPHEMLTDKIRVIASIKEYYPPKRDKGPKAIKEKTPKSEERHATINRAAARAFKRLLGPISESYEIAIVDESTLIENGIELSQQFEAISALPSDKFQKEIKLAVGPLRREREFVVKKINSRDKALVGKDTYSLKGRITKDRMNHRDGDYTVIQYAGEAYTAVHCDKNGKRLEQHTYNSEGELTKALGEAAYGGARKKRTSPPSDKVSALISKGRVATHEMFQVRKTWMGCEFNGAGLPEENEETFEPYTSGMLTEAAEAYLKNLSSSPQTPRADIQEFLFAVQKHETGVQIPQATLEYLEWRCQNGLLPKGLKEAIDAYQIEAGTSVWAVLPNVVKISLKNIISNDPNAPPAELRPFFFNLEACDVHEDVRSYVVALKRNPNTVPPEAVRQYLLTGSHPDEATPDEIKAYQAQSQSVEMVAP